MTQCELPACVEARARWQAIQEELQTSRAELKAVLQLAVDKWLDDEEGNPATRAARAREVVLKAIESAEKKWDELLRAAKQAVIMGDIYNWNLRDLENAIGKVERKEFR